MLSQQWCRYDRIKRAAQKSAAISKGRVADYEFDMHLFRLVLLFRVKQVKVENQHIKLLAKKILSLSKFNNSPAHKLKFSPGWLSRWKKRHHVVKRKSAKTHIAKALPADIDVWQARMQELVESKNIPLYLNGNKDETPTKLNVASAHTLDVKGTAEVRYGDQGHLKDQFTTYCGGWAGAMKSAEELTALKPDIVKLNHFTKDGHVLPSLSIFKGKTAVVIVNVLLEACEFDPLFMTYLQHRPPQVQ